MGIRTALLIVLSLGVVTLSGCTSPSQNSLIGGETQAAGEILNVLPVWTSFTGDRTTIENSGSDVEVFSMEILDTNGEDDLQSISLSIVEFGLSAVVYTHTINATNLAATSEPASYDANGWKVWSGTVGDGTLFAKYRSVVDNGAPLGARTTTPSVTDGGLVPVLGTPDVTTVILFDQITVALDPVDALGVAQTAASWGAWTADPGDSNVASLNYLVITNTGLNATASAIVDFTDTSFTGTTDASESIAIDSNIQFAVFQTTNALAVPNDGVFTYGATSSDGSVSVQFSAVGEIAFVAYRFVSVPSVLEAQTYTAGFTVTES